MSSEPWTISWAIRLRLFAIACSSSSVFGLACAGSGNRSPFRPHGTELKDVERAGAYRVRRTAAGISSSCGSRSPRRNASSVGDELVRLRHRLDRIERRLERVLRNEHLL